MNDKPNMSPNMDRAADHDDPLVNAIRRDLDRSCDALDGYTLSRLHRMRSNALAQPQSRWKSLLLPFSGLVTACALVLVVSVSLQTGGLPTENTGEAALEDIELLTSAESLDMYENYEFYQWLAEN